MYKKTTVAGIKNKKHAKSIYWLQVEAPWECRYNEISQNMDEIILCKR